jgi:hypothetical protein
MIRGELSISKESKSRRYLKIPHTDSEGWGLTICTHVESAEQPRPYRTLEVSTRRLGRAGRLGQRRLWRDDFLDHVSLVAGALALA